ncbi:MAG: hypothetical protein ACK41T_07465 [Pseudobdellovibrio sp.]
MDIFHTKYFVLLHILKDYILVSGNKSYKISLKEYLTLQKIKKYVQVTKETEGFNTALKFKLLYKKSLLKKTDVISTSSFIKIIDKAITMWKPLPDLHRIFVSINNSPILYAHYLLEYTSFVASSGSYFKLAFSSEKDRKIKNIIREIYNTEKNHHKNLVKALRISEKDFKIHKLNIGTYNLISFLHYLAYIRPESLVVCLAIFESDIRIKKQVKNFYSQHIESIDFDPNPFIQHVLLDYDENHMCSWKKIFYKKNIDVNYANQIVDDLHKCKHLVENWYEQILRENGNKINKNIEVIGKLSINNIINVRPNIYCI